MWYYAENDTQKGPISQADLKKRIADNQLSPGDLVWTEGMSDWKPWGEVPELSVLKKLIQPQVVPYVPLPVMQKKVRASSSGEAYRPSWFRRNIIWLATLCVLLLLGGIGWPLMAYYQVEQAKAHFIAAEEARLTDRPALALEEINRAIYYQQNPQYYFEKSLLRREEKDYEGARTNMELALEKAPENGFYHQQMANCIKVLEDLGLSKDEHETVIDHLKKATELDPGNSAYQYGYGRTLIQYGQVEKGLGVLEGLRQSDPDYWDVWNDLAIYYSEEKPAQSLAIRQELVKKFPAEPWPWHSLAVYLHQLGRKNEAIAAYRKSIQLDPDTGENAALNIEVLTGEKIPKRYQQPMPDVVLPAELKGRRAIVQASINGYSGKFLVDVDAQASVLHEDFLRKNGITWGNNGHTITYEGSKGHVSTSVLYCEVKLGSMVLHHMDFAVIPKDENSDLDGVIGQEALQDLELRGNKLHHVLKIRRKE